jgi:hypothetical protein
MALILGTPHRLTLRQFPDAFGGGPVLFRGGFPVWQNNRHSYIKSVVFNNMSE